jgi:hypothetical protein
MLQVALYTKKKRETKKQATTRNEEVGITNRGKEDK